MSLRPWQRVCIGAALKKFETEHHFLCMATPGAGKTVMAANLASELLQQHKIDFVICFAPTKAITSSIEETFSSVLGKPFDGLMGAVGSVFTYHGMRGVKDSIWTLLETRRVLVVLDEIHHCSGHEDRGLNAWGREIYEKIRNKAAYTLALTGTPWRSDFRPIALASYNGSKNCDLQYDFSYGLNEAIEEGVCQSPNIVLLDNDQLSYRTIESTENYCSLPDLLANTDAKYQSVLDHERAVSHCLSLACARLDRIRIRDPRAGGLAVTSSVKHAQFVADLLEHKFGESPVLVSYQNPFAQRAIEDFRESNERWIVSVGMVSEGTDIPRLQVCCHLSRVKTELYFRQVLGRVLRTTNDSLGQAWLYTFAEPSLKLFAQRLAEEAPSTEVLKVRSLLQLSEHRDARYETNDSHKEVEWSWPSAPLSGPKFDGDNLIDDARDVLSRPYSSKFGANYSLDCLGRFRQTLLRI